MNLNLIQKFKIFIYILFNNVDTIYILTPKNFYYYLPFFFRNIKFYAITIESKKSRPSAFLLKYLYKYVILDRNLIKKRKSSYNIQENLIEFNTNKINLNKHSQISHNFKYPNNFAFFHCKDVFFRKLLNWELHRVSNLLDYLSNKFENVLFSSELFNDKINNYFLKHFNHYDFDTKHEKLINKKNIFFLKNVDGYDLFDAVRKSTKVISPEGIITHMAYFLDKPVLALMHFNLNNRRDFINQIISCKEWFPPKNYEYSVLKKDFEKSIEKLDKRI